MPSLVTHLYTADNIVNSLDNESLVEIIQNNRQEYNLGAQGPDLWLYHCGLPWKNGENDAISDRYANMVHQTKINEFFKSCVNTIYNCQDKKIMNAMISYVAGHLTHWATDSTCHPYVDYFSGGSEEEYRFNHVRLESMIDNFIIEILKKENRACYKNPKSIILHDELCEISIDSVYKKVLKEVYNEDLPDGFTKEALDDFYETVSLMNDKVGFRFTIIRIIENLMDKKWNFTKHFITEKKDLKHDVLNLKKKEWCHPYDDTEKHNENFYELLEIAKQKGIKVLNLFSKAIKNNECEELTNYLANRNYESGRDYVEKTKFYEVIY